MYLYYYIFRQRSSLPLPVYICPYHTKMNKSLVPEWPTFTDVYSFTVSYKLVFLKRNFEILNLLIQKSVKPWTKKATQFLS